MIEKKKVKSIDDYFSDMRNRTHSKLESSFKNYEDVTNEGRLNQIALDLIQPAMDDFYNTFVKEIDKKGIENEQSIANKKKKDVQAAVVEALKVFFKKARPSVIKAIEGVTDVEEQYKILTREYNTHTGVGVQGSKEPGIDSVIENYIGNKQAKLGELKRELYQRKALHVNSSLGILRNQAYQHFIGTYHAPEVAAHLKKQAQKKGYEVVDETKFMGQEHQDLLPLHYGLTSDTLEHKKYHLKKVEKK